MPERIAAQRCAKWRDLLTSSVFHAIDQRKQSLDFRLRRLISAASPRAAGIIADPDEVARSCGMVTIPAAMASRGLLNRESRPSSKTSP